MEETAKQIQTVHTKIFTRNVLSFWSPLRPQSPHVFVVLEATGSWWFSARLRRTGEQRLQATAGMKYCSDTSSSRRIRWTTLSWTMSEERTTGISAYFIKNTTRW